MTTKEEVQALLKRLPDRCTLEDIQYHLYVIKKVKKGLAKIKKGILLTQMDAEKRLIKKLK